ncbi:MAG: hypothetical protein IH614_13385 [Desulfuromonadales bacterium]|nr:hypothetical protein [Desulfuromonadales bacterium]
MKRSCRLLLSLCFFLTGCATAQAGPKIIGLAGDLSAGGSVMVLGQGFGGHSLRTEWLGGPDGPIETTSTGSFFERDGWSVVPFPDKFRPVISRENAYSGKQAILFDSVRTGDGRTGLAYDSGGAVTFGYASWMAYIDTGGAEGQWKMFRLNWECNVKDTWPELVMFNWFGQVDTLNVRREKEDRALRFYPSGYPEAGEWVRLELLLQPSSAPGKADGSVELWVHRPGKEIRQLLSRRGIETYLPGEERRWRYFVFQNYLGNGLAGHGRVWIDDLLIQDTPARVEIGNAPRWSQCRQREVQSPRSWQDERIVFSFNPGRLAGDEPLYLYVVDGQGRVNEHGFAIGHRRVLAELDPLK